jgi:hypothetical protein
MFPHLPLSEVACRDLDVSIVGQLEATHLPLSDEFEAGPVKIVDFEAAFRGRGLGKQDLEHAP